MKSLDRAVRATVDLRVVSATNRPLHELVASGEFREDLLYRLNLITISLPPLRDRRADVPRLAAHFLGLASRIALTIASARIESLNRFMSGFADVVRLPLPNPRDVELAPVIEDIARLLRPELELRRVVLLIDVPAETRARVDQSQFEQVIINVIRNAMESIGESGQIAVGCRDGVLSIADSGKGIDIAARDEIFTPFFTTKPEGRGLGLTVVSEILTNHHLPFSLANREGGGAEFRVTLTECQRTISNDAASSRKTGASHV